MTGRSKPIRVLCVDDNEFVAKALERRLVAASDLHWVGWVDRTEEVRAKVEADCPDVILMDIDMPGKDSFEVVAELAIQCPDARVLMLSGHVRRDLVDRAFKTGAWGYISKDAEPSAILDAIRQVAEGEVVIGPELDVGQGSL